MPASTGGLSTQVLNYSRKPVVTIGGSIGQGDADGALLRQVFATAQNPGATAADNVLAVFSLPALLFDEEGRGIMVRAIGDFGANGNTKTVKIILNPTAAVVGSTVTGGTTVASTGAVLTNGSTFFIEGSMYKTGSLGSNTQLAIPGVINAGSVGVAPAAVAAMTAVESGAILVAITGNAATAVADIGLRLFEITGLN